MRVLKAIGLVLALLLLGLAVAWAATAPTGPPDGSQSALRLERGAHEVGKLDLSLVDESRKTAPNNDYLGAPTRTLETTVWYPESANGAHPLVVYSHGFMSFRSGGAYIAEHLASRGYVVISADHPLTHFGAPGGPQIEDVVNQPGDVRFLIDSVLGWSKDERPFAGRVDPDRIGVMGLSLGGMTMTLASFHPQLRDPRIKAAVSIAGPIAIFQAAFFAAGSPPFLMIGGTIDAMVDFETNAAVVPERVPGSGLVAIEGASHTGFSDMADGLLRLIGNPDRIGCAAVTRNLTAEPREDVFAALGGPEAGIVAEVMPLPCQQSPLPDAIQPGRQHMITLLATTAFFEANLSGDPATRRVSNAYLRGDLASDFPEVEYVRATAPRP